MTTKRLPKKGIALETEVIAKFGAAMTAMEAEGMVSPWLANLLRLSLVCALRPSEVRTLQWSRINLPRRKMVVVGKGGQREIDLTDDAVSILQSTPRLSNNPHVFAGRRVGQPIAGVHKALGLIQARAGIEHFRPYDLRHSAR